MNIICEQQYFNPFVTIILFIVRENKIRWGRIMVKRGETDQVLLELEQWNYRFN